MRHLKKHLFDIMTELTTSVENILKESRKINDLSLGYTVGILAEKSNISSPIILGEFFNICYNKGDYERAFDYASKLMKITTINEENLDKIREHMSLSSKHIINRYTNYNRNKIDEMYSIISRNKILNSENNLITVTMTTCKRYDLFSKTVISFLECCNDLENIKEWIVVDDNSDPEDKIKMVTNFPFINFIWKTPEEKGHPRSMNILLKHIKTPFIFHIEDDWIFYRKEKYLSNCIDILNSNPIYGQALLNRSYGERTDCYNIVCPSSMKFSSNNIRYYEHTYYTGNELLEFNNQNKIKNCTYWPHYSLRVGMTRTDIFNTIGVFNEQADHFEMEYANRYVSHYKTVFMDNIYCYHSGRCTFERGNGIKNAYDLNNENQFVKCETKCETENEVKTKISPVLSLTEEEKKIPLYTIPEENENVELTKEPIQYKTKTYVINLERRPDRLKQFIINNHDQLHQLQYKIFNAVDGLSVTSSPKILKLFETGDYKYRKGIIGCAGSHLKIWNELIISELDIVIVLEDDITLAPNFINKLISCLNKLPPDNWDILFLGHFLYPQLRTENDREDKFPEVELWSKEDCIKKSMGGTIGYVIHKRGAMKMYNHIREYGIYNAIDWVMFKNNNANIYYCYPHLVFSDCVTNNNKPDSDIQYDCSSLCLSDEERLKLEIEWWKSRGEDINIVNEIPCRDDLITKVHFIKTNEKPIQELVNSLEKLPLCFYSIKNEYLICIPSTRMDGHLLNNCVLDGGYLNVNNPV